jgi:iron complex transport system substrate-binding protein
VYAPAGTPDFGTDWRTQVRTVAAALGRADAGESVVGGLEDRITAAAEAHPEFAGRTAVAAASFSGQFGAYLPGDGRLDLLTDLGFAARPDLAALPAQGFYAEVSAERADLLDADVSVLFPIGGTAEALAADPVVAALPAARDGRLVVLDPADPVTQAFSTASPPALEVALDGLVPRLATAVARLG